VSTLKKVILIVGGVMLFLCVLVVILTLTGGHKDAEKAITGTKATVSPLSGQLAEAGSPEAAEPTITTAPMETSAPTETPEPEEPAATPTHTPPETPVPLTATYTPQSTETPVSEPTTTPTSTMAPTATAAPSATATEEPAATATHTPTETLVLQTATHTPQPTDTRVPEPTSTPTSTMAATATAMPSATPTEVPTGEATPYASGGLGLSKEQWEEEHVETRRDGMFVDYDDGRYSVIFIEDKVNHVELNFADTQPTLAEARELAGSLFPEDADLVETYSPEGFPELTVDLYMSASLQERFDSNWFTGGEPGNFIAIYGVFDGKVPRVVIGLGNNP